MNNNYYYFTFGSEGQLFKGGWVKIKAQGLYEAQQKFIKHFGNKARKGQFLNYSFDYTEEKFQASGMQEEGNIGAYCHEIIE